MTEATVLAPTASALPTVERPASMGTPRSRGSHIVIADGLRSAAILMVVAYHLIWLSKPTLHGHVVSLGYLGVWGVNCFFVLTGFLLGRPYIEALLEGRPLPSMRLFLARRFLRIYPLYAVAVLVTAAIAPLSGQAAPSAYDIVTHLLFLHDLSPATAYTFNSPLWTMAVDVSFYLALPFAMLLLKGLLPANRVARKAIIATTIIAAVAFAMPYRFLQFELHPESMTDYAAMTVHIRNMFGMSTAFGIGLMIALLAVLRVKAPRWLCGALAIGALSLAALQLSARLEVSDGNSLIAVFQMTLVDPLAALSAGLMLFALVCSGLSFSTIPGSIVVRRIAGVAYAIYLFHMPILGVVHAIVLRGITGTGALLALAVTGLPVVFGLAWVAHRFVERPLLELKGRFHEV
jgi:peptidoglycan/LPS O-acetylase OafA/YrhL